MHPKPVRLLNCVPFHHATEALSVRHGCVSLLAQLIRGNMLPGTAFSCLGIFWIGHAVWNYWTNTSALVHTHTRAHTHTHMYIYLYTYACAVCQTHMLCCVCHVWTQAP